MEHVNDLEAEITLEKQGRDKARACEENDDSRRTRCVYCGAEIRGYECDCPESADPEWAAIEELRRRRAKESPAGSSPFVSPLNLMWN